MYWTPENRRRKGRPRQSWQSKVTADVREVLQGRTVVKSQSVVHDGEAVLNKVLLLHMGGQRGCEFKNKLHEILLNRSIVQIVLIRPLLQVESIVE